jgi:hypothetical protein
MAETAAITKPCAVDFWTFAVPVILGMTGAHGVGLAAKKIFHGDHEKTQEAVMFATKFGAFWLIAGFAWIGMCKRNGMRPAS